VQAYSPLTTTTAKLVTVTRTLSGTGKEAVSWGTAYSHHLLRPTHTGTPTTTRCRFWHGTEVGVVGYRAAPGYKAAAFHAWGRLLIIARAASQREQALAACNRDPDRDDKDGTCLLYSVDNQVVLSKRLSVPLTAQ
jgi:hypothetical protein